MSVSGVPPCFRYGYNSWTVWGFRSLESRHLLYLQLRKSILESQIQCTDADLIALGGLALQAEIGDCVREMTAPKALAVTHTHQTHILHFHTVLCADKNHRRR